MPGEEKLVPKWKGLRRVSISMARVINLGNYESFRAEAGLELDVPEDQMSTEVWDQAQAAVEDRLNQIVKPIEKALEANEDRRKSKK